MFFLFSWSLGSRRLSKRLNALHERLEELETAVVRAFVDSGCSLKGIIVCLAEAPDDLIAEIPNDDKIYQVEVGYLRDGVPEPQDEQELLSLVARKVTKVLTASPFPEPARREAVRAVAQWRDSTN